MKSRIETKFSNCILNACIDSESKPKFYIVDNHDSKKSSIFRGENKLKFPYITVENINEKMIFVLSIDNCLFKDGDGKKCDCAVFDDISFHLIEIKKAADENRRIEQRLYAIEQLYETLLKLREVDFSGYSKYAHVCVGYFKPFPSINSSLTSHRLRFLEDFDTILKQGNCIKFH